MKFRIAVGLVVMAAIVAGLSVWLNRGDDLSPAEQDAAAWLVEQVPSDTSLFESRYGAKDEEVFVDYGLNLELSAALRDLDEYETADRIYAAVIEHADEYVEVDGTIYAGPLGKLATYVEENGDDPTDVVGRDLIADLKKLMVADGDEAGRFKDDPDGAYQSANTIGQSWAIRALDGADESTDVAVEFLVAQQCDDGGFRLYQAGDVCESAVDATVYAVEALDEVGGYDDQIADAIDWLAGQQASNGSYQADGVANANSTGLAAEALDEHGEGVAAEKAVQWIRTLQLHAGPDAGAIGFSDDVVTGTGKSAIDALALDQYLRATVQVVPVLALGGDG